MTIVDLRERRHAPGRRVVAAFDRMDPSKPVTNKQLAEAINRTHDCIHQTGKELGERVDKLAEVVAKNHDAASGRNQALDVRLARMEGALGVKVQQGVDPPKVGRKLAGMGLWTAIFSLMGSMAGAAALYRIAEPVIVAAAVALRHALLSAG